MVSHGSQHSTVTNKIAYDQLDLHSTNDFECVMDRRCQALVSKLVSKLETLDA